MRLRADVRKVTGNTRHFIGGMVEGDPVPVRRIPAPARVEISEEEGAHFLLHFNAEGVCIADTWHQTLEGAKRQAAFEFGIADGEWRPAE